jgi:hypothetical protein
MQSVSVNPPLTNAGRVSADRCESANHFRFPPDYQGNFGYKAASSGQKLEVSIGVVNPQFSANSLAYKTRGENDPVFKQLVSSLGATFNEVLIAKGFNTKGPFASLNDMTFPDKKGSDLGAALFGGMKSAT